MDPKAFANTSAFPWVSQGGVHEHQVVEGGLNKREYFAAQALQGILANSHYEPPRRHKLTAMAADAVSAADALLAELAK